MTTKVEKSVYVVCCEDSDGAHWETICESHDIAVKHSIHEILKWGDDTFDYEDEEIVRFLLLVQDKEFGNALDCWNGSNHTLVVSIQHEDIITDIPDPNVDHMFMSNEEG